VKMLAFDFFLWIRIANHLFAPMFLRSVYMVPEVPTSEVVVLPLVKFLLRRLSH
jgi:hypothetical protein